MTAITASYRERCLENLNAASFDLIIIGGGITGAGIAWDASLKGIKVLLLEQSDFASGTSSKSTKLIHGGLRYLKQFQFQQVFEVGRERAIVHSIARFLVRPEKMLLPIYSGGSLSRISAYLALWLYDFLAGVKPADAFRFLGPIESSLKEPLLPKKGLLGAFLYSEYQTDDYRLTWALLQSAIEKGAICLPYCQVMNLLREKGKHLSGLTFRDTLTGKVHQVNSSAIVNAAGPWVPDILVMDAYPAKKHLLLSKGTHIVVPHHYLPLKQAIYFDDFSKSRMLFAIPRWETTYIGTTDIVYAEPIHLLGSSKEEVDYILLAVNAFFSITGLQSKDIISSWVGLRPLVYEVGKLSTDISRKDEIMVSPSGLLTIAGGKLTGFRKMAEKSLKVLVNLQKGKKPFQGNKTKTHRVPLAGNSFETAQDLENYVLSCQESFRVLQINPALAERYVRRYGDRLNQILDDLDWSLQPEDALLSAEIRYGIHREMVLFPTDFIQRQTGMVWYEKNRCLEKKNLIFDVFTKEMQWDEKTRQKQEALWAAFLPTVTSFHNNEINDTGLSA